LQEASVNHGFGRRGFAAISVALLVALLAPLAAAQSDPNAIRSIFSSEPISARSNASTVKRVEQTEWIEARGLPQDGVVATIDYASLVQSEPGDRFMLRLPGRGERVFRTERVWTAVNGGRTWVGAFDDAGTTRRAFVSEFEGVVSGHFDTGETEFEMLPANDAQSARVYLIDLAAMNATRFFSTAPDFIAPPPLAERPQWLREDGEARLRLNAEKMQRSEQKAAPSPQSTIDVMVAYTAGMVTRYGSVSGVVTRLNTLVTYTNTAYVNSEVAITLRLVHSVQVSYTDTNANDTALYEISGTNGSSSVTIPPSLSGIAGLRNTYGADLVALIRPFSQSTHAGCGVAWIGGFDVSDIATDAGFGYAVVGDGSDVGGGSSFCPNGSFAHELGHNMGLMHDRANNGTTSGTTPCGVGVPCGATRYAFGFINGSGVGDIMSYANQRGQAFSSPAVRCTGTTCSVSGGTTALGIAADGALESCVNSSSGCAPAQSALCNTNPSTCADASRALNFTRVKVSQYRATVSGGSPGISGSITLAAGGSVPGGTTLCANPSSGVSCGAVSGNTFSCTVPSGWTGTLHLQAGNNLRVAAKRFTMGVTTLQSGEDFTVYNADAALNSYSYFCNFDIDNNGLNEAAVDGVMIVRKLAGITGTAQTVSNSGVCAQRTSASDRLAFLADQDYDINSNGGAQPLRDGLVILRLMLGMSGTQAVAGTGLSWGTLQAQINNKCGTSF
jgi:Metallo-peptidase family M12B Reprolysin-like